MEYGLSLARVDGTNAPVSLAEAKAHVRQDHSADDTVLSDLVSACAEAVEDAQGRVLQKSTVTLTLDEWPSDGVIRLPRFPVQSVTSITYLEEGQSSATTLSSSLYRVDTNSLPPRVVLKKNQQWPTASLEYGAPITVTFVAGYENNTWPEKSKHAVKLLLGHWYAHREAVVSGTISVQVPESYRSLILQDRLW